MFLETTRRADIETIQSWNRRMAESAAEKLPLPARHWLSTHIQVSWSPLQEGVRPLSHPCPACRRGQAWQFTSANITRPVHHSCIQIGRGKVDNTVQIDYNKSVQNVIQNFDYIMQYIINLYVFNLFYTVLYRLAIHILLQATCWLVFLNILKTCYIFHGLFCSQQLKL